LQTRNRKQQRKNTNVNLATKHTHQWRVTEVQFQSLLQNPKRANYNNNNRKTREKETSKQETSQQATRKNQPMNQ
jgi:hypothetical protein